MFFLLKEKEKEEKQRMEKYKNLSKMTIWDLCAYNAIKNCPNTKKTSNRALLISWKLFIIANLIAEKKQKKEKKQWKINTSH